MTVQTDFNSGFAYQEWHRLSALADKYEPKMRLAYTRATRDLKHVNQLELRKVLIDILSETCITSAREYGLVFSPNSPIYYHTVDDLTSKYIGAINNRGAQRAVARILPKDLPFREKKRRLDDALGLDERSALRVERYRQQLGDGPSAERDVERVRRDAVRIRGNLIAATETNRAINTSLEALWIDNIGISKADSDLPDNVTFFDRSIRNIGSIPRRARKEIVTRRDGKVCDYCFELEGIKARLGEDFETHYGFFSAPPFHPRCRCFMIVSA